MQIAILSSLKVSSDYVLSLVRKWEKYVSNCGRRISRPEVNFTKLFHVTKDLIYIYNIYKFQIDHLKNKRDLGHRKSRKWKVFRRLPEVDKSVSGRSNIFWYYKRDLLNWYRLNFKIKILKISDIFYISYHFRCQPEVTDDTVNPIVHVY